MHHIIEIKLAVFPKDSRKNVCHKELGPAKKKPNNHISGNIMIAGLFEKIFFIDFNGLNISITPSLNEDIFFSIFISGIEIQITRQIKTTKKQKIQSQPCQTEVNNAPITPPARFPIKHAFPFLDTFVLVSEVSLLADENNHALKVPDIQHSEIAN